MIYDYSTLNGADPLQYAMFNKTNYDEAAALVYELAETCEPVRRYHHGLPVRSLEPDDAESESGPRPHRPGTGAASERSGLVNNAADAKFLTSTVYAYTDIYTPTAAYAGNQEFLEYSTPEPNLAWPAGFLLLLAAVGMKFRRKIQRFRL